MSCGLVVAGMMAVVLAVSSASAQRVGPAGARAEPRFSPAQRCIEHYARAVGHLAYLDARLELTSAQQPLWDNWSQAVTAGAEKTRDVCRQGAASAGTPRTAVERSAHYQQVLATKADGLKAAQPALEALYQALTPEQRSVMDRPMRTWRHRGWHSAGGGGADGRWGRSQQ